ncbi:MAG: hypothetical protein ACK41V_23865 [Acidovorax sp.]|uniref:hypothetical protein n=1 Tax=Acidovorax sp. TaxID=1872122 RepID=UPI00391D417C
MRAQAMGRRAAQEAERGHGDALREVAEELQRTQEALGSAVAAQGDNESKLQVRAHPRDAALHGAAVR